MEPDTRKIPVLVLVGPTAVGKTNISLQLAQEFGCEIISMDSMQVYRFMDIGTAKILPEERQGIAHHCIDIVNPDDEYDAARFAEDARLAIAEIHTRGKIPLLTGGTGLYLKALQEGLFQAPPSNPGFRAQLKQRIEREGATKLHAELAQVDIISAQRIHENDSARIIRGLEIFHLSGIPWSEFLLQHKQGENLDHGLKFLLFGLNCSREDLYRRINIRTGIMIESGFEQEVRSLLHQGYSRDLKSMKSIGYKHMLQYIYGEIAHQEMIDMIARDTRRYAKRQLTWFNNLENLQWFPIETPESLLFAVKTALA